MAHTPKKPSGEPNGLGVSLDRQVFAANIERLRQERGLTQVQLAELSGISQPHVSALERGVWEPRLATIMALARALDVQPGDLLPPSNHDSVSDAR